MYEPYTFDIIQSAQPVCSWVWNIALSYWTIVLRMGIYLNWWHHGLLCARQWKPEGCEFKHRSNLIILLYAIWRSVCSCHINGISRWVTPNLWPNLYHSLRDINNIFTWCTISDGTCGHEYLIVWIYKSWIKVTVQYNTLQYISFGQLRDNLIYTRVSWHSGDTIWPTQIQLRWTQPISKICHIDTRIVCGTKTYIIPI